MDARTILLAACRKEDPGARRAFLDEACGGNPALRREVEALLRAYEEAGATGGPARDATRALIVGTGQTPPPCSAGTVAPGGVMELPPELASLLAPPQGPEELGRLGGYSILGELGRGGMGVVFLAQDAKLRRQVAIKALLPGAMTVEARQRFLREAQATAAIENDHVVPIYQVDEDRGIPYLVMPLLKGEPLDRWLESERQPAAAEIVRLGKEIARGLAAAHAQGLMHRDIKPANIWLEAPNRRVKILDFGLAKPVDDSMKLTESGLVAGTPSYMSPEQGRGMKLDPRSDLFSLGAVLYRLCTGILPFDGPSIMAVLTALATQPAIPVAELNPKLPPALADLVMQLLAKNPDQRPQSAQGVVERLEAIERGENPVGLDATARMAASQFGPQTARCSTRRMPLFLAAAAALAALALGVWLLGRGNSGGAAAVATAKDSAPAGATIPSSTPAVAGNRLVELWTSPDYVWTTPESLGARINAGKRNLGPTLTDDERTLIFWRDGKFYSASRGAVTEPFGKPAPLPDAINDQPGENASLSGDGLLLAFISKRDGVEEVWWSTRKSIAEPFGPPVRLVAPVNNKEFKRAPVLAADGLTLFLTDNRAGGIGGGDIVMFTRPNRDQPFGNPRVLPASVNTAAFDVADWLSSDGLALIHTTHEKEQPFQPQFHLRPTRDAPFGPGRSFGPPLDGISWSRPWLSPDGQRLYFNSRDLPGSNGDLYLWMTRRVPKAK